MTPATESPRTVTAVVVATYALEGAGFGVYRSSTTATLDLLDPFLLLDDMEPKHGPTPSRSEAERAET